MHCHQINKKCFRKYDSHKTIEILCCKSKNFNNKLMSLFKVTRILWSLYTALICVVAPMNKFQHREFDIFPDISFLPIHLCTLQNQIFFYFWMLALCRNRRKQKILNHNTELGTLCNDFRAIKLCIISVNIYTAIMVKVTFEISNI